MDMAGLGYSDNCVNFQCGGVAVVFSLAYLTACYYNHGGNGCGKIFQGLDELG